MGIKRFCSQNIDYMVLSITQIMPDNYTTLSYGTWVNLSTIIMPYTKSSWIMSLVEQIIVAFVLAVPLKVTCQPSTWDWLTKLFALSIWIRHCRMVCRFLLFHQQGINPPWTESGSTNIDAINLIPSIVSIVVVVYCLREVANEYHNMTKSAMFTCNKAAVEMVTFLAIIKSIIDHA